MCSFPILPDSGKKLKEDYIGAVKCSVWDKLVALSLYAGLVTMELFRQLG